MVPTVYCIVSLVYNMKPNKLRADVTDLSLLSWIERRKKNNSL